MSFNSVKLLPIARIFSPKICRASLHRSAICNSYWRRRDAISELSNAVQSFENYMKEFDREMNRVFGDFRRMSPINIPRIFAPFDLGRSRDIPVVSTDGDNKLYKLELNMQGMKPEDINISLKDNELSITARRDEKNEDGSRFVRESAYHYTLPSEINPDTVRSTFSNGILTIEAQLPALESKEIPINIESGEKKSASSDSTDQKK